MKIIMHIAASRTGHNWIGNMIKSWCPDVDYYDLENLLPKSAKKFPADKCIIVLQTRDMLNWLASSFELFGKIYPVPFAAFMEGVRKFYSSNYLIDHDVVKVLYDDFFVDQSYRERVCAQLGGVYNEAELQKIVGFGRSSFHSYAFDENAQSMPVLDRYTHLSPASLEQIRPMIRKYKKTVRLYKRTLNDQEKLDILTAMRL